MKKRFNLENDVVCHIFKKGKRANGTLEPNDGSGGHATQDKAFEISEYRILAVPKSKKDSSNDWFSADKATAIKCPFPHIATFKISGQSYTNKSMFPGNVTKDALIKTIERALSSCTSAHTYIGAARVNSANGKPWVAPANFKRPLSDMTVENGSYVVGRANGIRIKGQKKGAHGSGLTSVFPDTKGFHFKP